jgi:dihydrolipoamide dehydrogenase
MASRQYEAVVIGAGPAGYVCAIRLAQLGVETAIIERGPVGGVCLNWGCIPSKAFIHVAKVYEEIKHAEEFGISVSGVKLDAKKLQAWKEGVVKQLTGGVDQLLKANKVEKIVGEVTFKDNSTLVVDKGGEKTEIAFRKAVVAVGGRPIEIPGFTIDGKTVLGAKGALALDEIPKDLVIIGGGVIGIEMGTFFAKFGAKVSIVEMTDQILPGTEKDLVRVVEKRLKKNNVEIFTGSKALGWKAKGKTAEVEIETASGKKTIKANKILMSVGVKPNTDLLNIDKTDVKLTERGFVQVDQSLRTTVPNIFAIGDVAGPPLLAHKGSKEGLVVADIIAGKNAVYDVRAMPAAIFTDPEIATVGLTEKEAQAKGYKVKSGRFPFAALGRAIADNDSDGFVRLVRDLDTDRVLGVQIVGAGASDMIAEAALAIEMGATAEDIALTVHTHPTLPEAIMEAAEASHGIAVHAVNRR